MFARGCQCFASFFPIEVPKKGPHIPDVAFSEAMPLARLGAVLVDGVQGEWFQAQRLRHVLDEVGVPIAEQADREGAYLKLPVVSPEHHSTGLRS